MLQKIIREVDHKTRAEQARRRIGAIGLAIAIGIAYFFLAQLSHALLAKSDGVALFWLAGGMSSGVLIVLGRDARLPVAGAAIVATVVAGLMHGRSVWLTTAFALC